MGGSKRRKAEKRAAKRRALTPEQRKLIAEGPHPFDDAFEHLLDVFKIEESSRGMARYVIARALDGLNADRLKTVFMMRLDKEDILAVAAHNERIYLIALPKTDIADVLKSVKHGPHEKAWFTERAQVVTDEPMLKGWIDWLRRCNGGTLG